MQIRCLLWDFGDTLCDERFIWSSGPEWMEVYESFDSDGLGASWSLGEINTDQFAAELSKRMGIKCDNTEALLIDNKASNIDDWVGIGGAGYLYTDDRSFSGHAAAGIDALATRDR